MPVGGRGSDLFERVREMCEPMSWSLSDVG